MRSCWTLYLRRQRRQRVHRRGARAKKRKWSDVLRYRGGRVGWWVGGSARAWVGARRGCLLVSHVKLGRCDAASVAHRDICSFGRLLFCSVCLHTLTHDAVFDSRFYIGYAVGMHAVVSKAGVSCCSWGPQEPLRKCGRQRRFPPRKQTVLQYY